MLCDCVFLEEEKIGHRTRARTWNNKMLMHKHRRVKMLQLVYASKCGVWRVSIGDNRCKKLVTDKLPKFYHSYKIIILG